jgi:type II secretory pathway predicted ATPase ExeA
MNLKEAISKTRVGYRKLSHDSGISLTALSRIANSGEYPAKQDARAVRLRISSALERHGVDPAAIEWPEDQAARAAIEPHAAPTITNQELELMQLDRNVLHLFNLRQNPFLNDVEEEEDVFKTPGYETVSQAVREAIEQRGFLAICAESGSGKTTIWEGIEAEYAGREDVVICKPRLMAKEKLTPEHLCRALIYGLNGDDARIPRDAEDRGRLLSKALCAIRTGSTDRKAVLFIDDAHFASASVLRQLKTFFEQKVGRYRLLAIVLVGLPTLKAKLAEFAEVGNRIRLIEVPPVPVAEYVKFKLARVGSNITKVFDERGFDAFCDRFRAPKRPALAPPLIINAACIRAMCALYANGAEPGERITREIVDALPGGAMRRVA